MGGQVCVTIHLSSSSSSLPSSGRLYQCSFIQQKKTQPFSSSPLNKGGNILNWCNPEMRIRFYVLKPLLHPSQLNHWVSTPLKSLFYHLSFSFRLFVLSWNFWCDLPFFCLARWEMCHTFQPIKQTKSLGSNCLQSESRPIQRVRGSLVIYTTIGWHIISAKQVLEERREKVMCWIHHCFARCGASHQNGE